MTWPGRQVKQVNMYTNTAAVYCPSCGSMTVGDPSWFSSFVYVVSHGSYHANNLTNNNGARAEPSKPELVRSMSLHQALGNQGHIWYFAQCDPCDPNLDEGSGPNHTPDSCPIM